MPGLGLAQFGADVLRGRAEPGGYEARSLPKYNKLGRRSGAFAADVTSEESVRGMVADIIAGHGRIDILINDFGTRSADRRPTSRWMEWQKVMDYNIRGCFICCKEVGAEMVKNRAGKIINHSSVARSTVPALCRLQFEQGSYRRSDQDLAVEWAPYNVFVNAIAPTFLRPNPGTRRSASPIRSSCGWCFPASPSAGWESRGISSARRCSRFERFGFLHGTHAVCGWGSDQLVEPGMAYWG